MPAVDTLAFVFSTFVFREVTHFAVFAVGVAVAVRIDYGAASVSLRAFLPFFAADIFALVFNACLYLVSVIVDIAFRTFADFIIAFKFTSAETAVERAFFILGQWNTVALFIFFVTVKAFAEFIAASVVNVTI